MPSTLGWYVLILVVAAAITGAVTLPARSIAIKIGYVDTPSERKVHDRTTPYGGGAAMFIGVCAAMVAASLVPAYGAPDQWAPPPRAGHSLEI